MEKDRHQRGAERDYLALVALQATCAVHETSIHFNSCAVATIITNINMQLHPPLCGSQTG